MSSPPLTPRDLRRIFEILDRNGDGLVSLDELNWLLERTTGGGLLLGCDDLESLPCAAGKTGLDFSEFSKFYQSVSLSKDEDEDEVKEEDADLAEAFKVFDLNGDGFVSCEELQSVLARLGLWEENCGRDCRAMIDAYDVDSNGLLDFQEFKKMMMRSVHAC